MKELRNANAILTGASRGLGVYIAEALAKKGVNLALAARSKEGLAETQQRCQGVKTVTVQCDVTSPEDLQGLVNEAKSGLGDIDILVNNAGVEITRAFTDTSIEEIDQILETNLHSAMRLTKLVLPGMMERGRGVIVNMASMAGKGPTPYNVTYSTSKAGMVGFTHSLAAELDGTGVEVSVVCPGFVSEAGMWSYRNRKAPFMLREVSPKQVSAAVLKAVRGQPEVLVTAGPIRPLLAVDQIRPGFLRWFVRRAGITDALRPDGAVEEQAAATEEPGS
jgi:short-subunit dehydrogenase